VREVGESRHSSLLFAPYGGIPRLIKEKTGYTLIIKKVYFSSLIE
jgi:hypothetical protein